MPNKKKLDRGFGIITRASSQLKPTKNILSCRNLNFSHLHFGREFLIRSHNFTIVYNTLSQKV